MIKEFIFDITLSQIKNFIAVIYLYYYYILL